MPKLPLGWEFDTTDGPVAVFEEWDAAGPFSTALPTKDQLEQVTDLFARSQQSLTQDSFFNYSNLSMKAIFGFSGLAGGGVENWRLPGIGETGTQLLTITGRSAGAMIEILNAAAYDPASLINVAFGYLGRIPVYGWIFELAEQVGFGIYDAVKYFQSEGPTATRPVLEYDPSNDVKFAEDIRGYMKTNDWTKVFMPQRIATSFERTEQTTFAGADANSWLVSPKGQIVGDVGGVCPIGIPQIVADYQFVKFGERWKKVRVEIGGREYTKTVRTGAFPPGDCMRGGVAPLCTNVGSFLPSATQLGWAIWSFVRENSANAFKIDQNAILGAWADWFASLIDYMQDTKDRGAEALHAAKILQSLSSVAICGNWGCQVAPYPSPYGDVIDVDTVRELFNKRGVVRGNTSINAFIGPKHPFDFGSPGDTVVTQQVLVEHVVGNQLDALYKNFLNTITVAYVDETFPAIANNPMVRSKWLERRLQLLDHPARFQVELDLIPDAAYRSQMSVAQRLGGTHVTIDARDAAPFVPLEGADLAPWGRPPRPTPYARPRGFGWREAAMLTVLGVVLWKATDLGKMR